jgi:hypothetical protein
MNVFFHVHIKSWLVRSALLTVGLVVGCASPSAPLAELPTHDLDLSVPSYAPPPAAPKTFLPMPLPSPSPSPQPAPLGTDQEQKSWAVSNARPWRYIVIHHSATKDGNAVQFDAQHRQRGWDGLGYHFVIDNGCGGADGRIEVGSRWKTQKQGAHTGGTPDNEYNEHGIGICLVGNFTRRMPTPAQMVSLHRLVGYLAANYAVAPGNIIGHCDAPDAATQCPGAALHGYVVGTLRWQASVQYAYKN